MFHAMGDVIAQDFCLNTLERGAHGGNLGHDIDTVAIVLDHAREAAHLPLGPAESLQASGLDVLHHGGKYTPTQYWYQALIVEYPS
jgi:hypothetical protein